MKYIKLNSCHDDTLAAGANRPTCRAEFTAVFLDDGAVTALGAFLACHEMRISLPAPVDIGSFARLRGRHDAGLG